MSWDNVVCRTKFFPHSCLLPLPLFQAVSSSWLWILILVSYSAPWLSVCSLHHPICKCSLSFVHFHLLKHKILLCPPGQYWAESFFFSKYVHIIILRACQCPLVWKKDHCEGCRGEENILSCPTGPWTSKDKCPCKKEREDVHTGTSVTLSAQVLGDSQLCCFKPSGLCYCVIVVPRLPSVLGKKFLGILIIRTMTPVEHGYPPVFIPFFWPGVTASPTQVTHPSHKRGNWHQEFTWLLSTIARF